MTTEDEVPYELAVVEYRAACRTIDRLDKEIAALERQKGEVAKHRDRFFAVMRAKEVMP